jgi:catechol 2,3-dioxygenase-like lactoylglutathione lyase family enzyme
MTDAAPIEASPGRQPIGDAPRSLSPIKLAHVVLRTAHYEETLQWWLTVLNAEVAFANDYIAFLTYDEEHHRLALLNDPGAEAPGHVTGLEHVAFTYGDLGALLQTYQRLRSVGINPVWSINHGPTTSLYYRDPDGNQAELQVDNFETNEELDAWFRSGAFAENPIGIEFDPEELTESYEAGVTTTQLLNRDRPQGSS